MELERFIVPDLYDIGTYSHIVRAGKTLYIAGQVARDLEGRTVGVGDAAAQVRGAFENLKRCLRSQGACRCCPSRLSPAKTPQPSRFAGRRRRVASRHSDGPRAGTARRRGSTDTWPRGA